MQHASASIHARCFTHFAATQARSTHLELGRDVFNHLALLELRVTADHSQPQLVLRREIVTVEAALAEDGEYLGLPSQSL
jgi:hypothetical protein